MNLWSRLFGPRSAADQALSTNVAEDVAVTKAVVAPSEDPAQRREDDVIANFDAQVDAQRDARDGDGPG